MTYDEIASLTLDDCNAARERVAEARKTRAGVSTVDYTLSQVYDEKRLATAKRYLIEKL